MEQGAENRENKKGAREKLKKEQGDRSKIKRQQGARTALGEPQRSNKGSKQRQVGSHQCKVASCFNVAVI